MKASHYLRGVLGMSGSGTVLILLTCIVVAALGKEPIAVRR